MKHFLLLGDYMLNAGPSNVNRSFIGNSDGSLIYVRNKTRFFRKLESISKCIFCNTIVFSGNTSRLELMIARILRKRIIYIMHGCGKYENDINKLGLTAKDLRGEKNLMEKANVIIAVSERYAEWVKNRFSKYDNKITFVNNGLDIKRHHTVYHHGSDNYFLIAVSGGDRPIKCNLDVCKAVEKLNQKGYQIQICAFGRSYPYGEPIFDYPFVERMGHMDKDEYYKKLESVDLMVVNSDVEPFGLVVGDALNCGCSLLMSKNVGALSIFERLSAEDVVEDNHNIDELAGKIEYLLKHSNAERLYESVDKEKCSNRQAYLNLKRICINE